MKSISRELVRRIDQFSIEHVGMPGIVLMENAGRNAADAIQAFLDGVSGKRIAVVCGAGNNGGDGFVLARHIDQRGGKAVVFLVAPEEKLSGDSLVNLNGIQSLGLSVFEVCGAGLSQLHEQLVTFDLVVDALGGTGIRGELRGDVADAAEQINQAGATTKVASLDIPTGLDCDTGQAVGTVVKADLTVTFVARKQGFDHPESQTHTGEVVVADIGLDAKRICKLMEQDID